ncbi:MAG: chemotaxis protein CheW [Anaerolineales bacterium]
MMNQRKKKVEEALGSLFSSSRKSAEPKEKNLHSVKKATSNKSEDVTSEGNINHPNDVPKTNSFPSPESEHQGASQQSMDGQAKDPPLQSPVIIPITVPEKEPLQSEGTNTIAKETQLETPHPSPGLSVPSPQERQIKSGNGNGKQPIQGVAEREEIRQLVVFSLAGESFGLPIDRVESIIKDQSITVVPHARPYVVGVTNLRGTVLPVIDLRRRFNYSDMESDEQQRIVVVSYRDEKIGLRVDAVSQVVSVAADAIEPPPPLVTAVINTSYITGIAKVEEQLVILLDLDKILSE